MDERDHIHSGPAVLADKPVVRGTRLAADFLLGLFASGWLLLQRCSGRGAVGDFGSLQEL